MDDGTWAGIDGYVRILDRLAPCPLMGVGGCLPVLGAGRPVRPEAVGLGLDTHLPPLGRLRGSEAVLRGKDSCLSWGARAGRGACPVLVAQGSRYLSFCVFVQVKGLGDLFCLVTRSTRL